MRSNARDRLSQDLRKDVSSFVLAQFSWAIDLPGMLAGVVQDRGDDPALIFRRDGRIPSIAEGQRENMLLPDVLR